MATIRSFNTGPDGREAEREALAQEQQGFFGDLAQGARTGGLRAMGALNTLAGHRANQLGLDGSNSLRTAQDYLQRADEAGQGLTSWEDADFGRKGVRWLGGALGQSLTTMVPALAAGATTRNPLVAGALATATTAPIEVGEQLLRQEQDPANAGKTSAERMDAALPYGVGAAALQSVPFLGTGSKLAGRTLGGAKVAREGILKTVRNEAVTGGLTEAGAEGIRQTGDQALNPNAEYNGKAMWDAGLQGSVMSGAVGAAGAPAHAFHKLTAAPGDLMRTGGIELNNLGEKVKGFVGSAKAKAEGIDLNEVGQNLKAEGESLLGRGIVAADKASSLIGRGKKAAEGIDLRAEGEDLINQGLASETAGKVMNAAVSGVDGAKAKAEEAVNQGLASNAMGSAVNAATTAYGRVARSLSLLKQGDYKVMERMANGEQFARPETFTGKADDALRQAVDADAKYRAENATKWAQELPAKYRTPEVAAAAADPTQPTNQRVIAAARRAWVENETTLGRVVSLGKKFATQASGKKGSKPSLDFREADRSIVSALAPYLQQNLPHLMQPEGLQQLAPPLRSAVTSMLKGEQLNSDQVFGLIDVLGDHTVAVLDQVRQGMKATDGNQTLQFFNAAEMLQAAQDAHTGLADAIRKNAPGGPDSVHPAELREVMSELVNWATNVKGDGVAQRVLDADMRRTLQREFGTKGAEAIMTALDNMVPRKENMLAGSPDAAGLAELEGEVGTKRVNEADKTAGADEPNKLYDNKGPVEKPRMRVLDKDLLMDEASSPGKNGFPSAQAQSRERAQRSVMEGREVRWATADELGPDHRLVKKAERELRTEGELEQGLKGANLDAFVAAGLKKMGAHVTDLPAGHLGLTDGDVAGMRIDKGRYNSPSAVKVGDGQTVFDAVKIVEKTAARLKGKEPWNPRDERGGRDARMFAEGIADLQDYLGTSFDVPDSTVINKQGLTWGEAKKAGVNQRAEPSTKADVAMEQGLPEMTEAELRAAFKRARDAWVNAESPDDAQRIAKFADRIKTELSRRAPETLADGQTERDPFGAAFQGETGLGDGSATFEMGKGATDKERALRGRLRTEGATPDGININGDEANRGGAPSLLGPSTEGSPDPKVVAAKKAAFLEKARSGDKALIETLKASNDAKGLQRAAQALFDEPAARETLDAINGRLSELSQDPDVAYGLLTRKYSLDATQMAPNAAGPRQSTFQEAGDYIKKVLGPKVEVEVANILHAGDFTPGWARGKAEDLIRLSVHHLNPMSAAFHESMHGLVEHLTKNKLGEATNVLLKAAASPTVTLKLRQLLKDSPEALAQLNNAEERVAYMYQFHASGVDLGLGAPAKGVFNKIAEFVRSVLGIWSNDQRALHIMQYFQQGNLPKAKSAGDIRAALMEPGTNAKLEWFKKASEPLRNLGEAVAVAGHQRLRDTEIPALIELADTIKLKGTGEGADPGFIPAAREERGIRMNKFADLLDGVNDDGMAAALEVLQGADRDQVLGNLNGDTKIGAVTAIHATRTLLREMKGYLDSAGVKMGDLGKDYFPRVYNLGYIAANKDAFLTVLKNHGVENAEGIVQKLMTSQGTEFDIEVNRPGMQAAKKRVLDMVPDEALRPFMEKDLLRIIDGYVTQATRRAEWAKRFDGVNEKGEPVPNGKLDELLVQARREGATDKDLDAANKYIKAVDGTLGDTISPEFRRLQGNLMVYQNLRTLPLMIFSSLVDPGGILVRGGTVGDAFGALKRGLAEIPKNFQADPKHDAATKLAADLGTIESAVLANALGEAYTQGMVGDTGRKINDTLFKYNLANQFNTSMRVAATEAAVKFLARHADGSGTHSARYLAELGLQPSDLKFDTNAEGKRGALKVTEADGLTPEQAVKMRQAINRWVDGAVLRPDAADKPVWMSDPHFALIAHLKQFTFAFQEVILKRAAHEMRHGNYTPIYALASYIPAMVVADTLKAALTGAQGPGEELDDLLLHGVERGGLLGVSQFPVDMLQDVGRGGAGLAPLLGPTLEQFTQAVQVVGGRRSFDSFAVDSMPANALFEHHLGGGSAEAAPAK